MWEGTQNKGVALLILAWAYILNASLAERKRTILLAVPYGAAGASETPPDPPATLFLRLEYSDHEELAWWKAITKSETTSQPVGAKSYLP